MHLVHRRIGDGDVFHLHVGAAVGLNEHRAQPGAIAELALRDGDALLRHLHQRRARLTLIRIFGPGGPHLPAHGHQCSPLACPVQRAAGDCDVLLVERVDEGGVVHALEAFEAREHDGVKLRVAD